MLIKPTDLDVAMAVVVAAVVPLPAVVAAVVPVPAVVAAVVPVPAVVAAVVPMPVVVAVILFVRKLSHVKPLCVLLTLMNELLESKVKVNVMLLIVRVAT